MIITNDITIHSAGINEIHEIPVNIIITPLKVELDNQRLESMIDSVKVCNYRNHLHLRLFFIFLLFFFQDPVAETYIAPIDVLWIVGDEGGNYYYSFMGEHRIEAHKILKRTTIRAKLIKSTLKDLEIFLGGSTPKYLK